jgi:hypothetical protein
LIRIGRASLRRLLAKFAGVLLTKNVFSRIKLCFLRKDVFMIDVNKPVTNPQLVDIMNKFSNERSAENEFILIERITNAHFLTPIIMKGEIENGVLKAGSTISFKMITNNSDESFFIAFTDWEELAKWSKEKEETLISTYDDLKGMVLKDTVNIKGFVINPYGQNIMITPEIMQYFSKKKSEIVIEKDTKVLLGQPSNYPYEMANALTKFFKKHKEVESAYLFLSHKEGDDKSNLLFVIGFVGEKATLFPQIAAVAQGYLGKDEYIELISLDSAFGKDATKDSTPFYKKKVWKLF